MDTTANVLAAAWKLFGMCLTSSVTELTDQNTLAGGMQHHRHTPRLRRQFWGGGSSSGGGGNSVPGSATSATIPAISTDPLAPVESGRIPI